MPPGPGPLAAHRADLRGRGRGGLRPGGLVRRARVIEGRHFVIVEGRHAGHEALAFVAEEGDEGALPRAPGPHEGLDGLAPAPLQPPLQLLQPKTSPKKLRPGRQAPGARPRQFVCQHRQTTICLSATSRARRRLPGETHRRRGMERGEKVLARAAARPRGRGRGHRGPGHGQHDGLLGHARGARDEGTLKLMVEPAQRARVPPKSCKNVPLQIRFYCSIISKL